MYEKLTAIHEGRKKFTKKTIHVCLITSELKRKTNNKQTHCVKEKYEKESTELQ